MRLFVSGPRFQGFHLGLILKRRDLGMIFPLWLWLVPIYAVLLAATLVGMIFVTNFISHLPQW